MNTNLMLTNSAMSMTSKEIADLTGKRHDNVKRTIETLLKQDVISQPQIEDGVKSANGVVEKLYVFDFEHKRDTYIIVAQLSPEFTGKLVDRWQELELNLTMSSATNKHPSLMLPSEIAAVDLKSWMTVADMLGVPKHYGQIESVRAVKEKHGIDFSPILTYSPAMNDIPQDEEMLEPTALGKFLGIKSGREMNLVLGEIGLQNNIGGQWIATELGQPICVKHAWTKNGTSGYNLKWNVEKVRKALDKYTKERVAA